MYDACRLVFLYSVVRAAAAVMVVCAALPGGDTRREHWLTLLCRLSTHQTYAPASDKHIVACVLVGRRVQAHITHGVKYIATCWQHLWYKIYRLCVCVCVWNESNVKVGWSRVVDIGAKRVRSIKNSAPKRRHHVSQTGWLCGALECRAVNLARHRCFLMGDPSPERCRSSRRRRADTIHSHLTL